MNHTYEVLKYVFNFFILKKFPKVEEREGNLDVKFFTYLILILMTFYDGCR